MEDSENNPVLCLKMVKPLLDHIKTIQEKNRVTSGEMSSIMYEVLLCNGDYTWDIISKLVHSKLV